MSTPTSRIQAPLVYEAALLTGSARGTARCLNCSRQYLCDPGRPDLRDALQKGLAAHRAAQPDSVREHVRIPRNAIAALAKQARAVGLSTARYLECFLTSLNALPEPRPTTVPCDYFAHFRLPTAWVRRHRGRLGAAYPARLRAALVEKSKIDLDGTRNVT